jgi:hypothetical protein
MCNVFDDAVGSVGREMCVGTVIGMQSFNSSLAHSLVLAMVDGLVSNLAFLPSSKTYLTPPRTHSHLPPSPPTTGEACSSTHPPTHPHTHTHTNIRLCSSTLLDRSTLFGHVSVCRFGFSVLTPPPLPRP